MSTAAGTAPALSPETVLPSQPLAPASQTVTTPESPLPVAPGAMTVTVTSPGETQAPLLAQPVAQELVTPIVTQTVASASPEALGAQIAAAPQADANINFTVSQHFHGTPEHSQRLQNELRQVLTDAQFTNFTINHISADAEGKAGFDHHINVHFADNGNYANQLAAMTAAIAVFNSVLVREQRIGNITRVDPNAIVATHVTHTHASGQNTHHQAHTGSTAPVNWSATVAQSRAAAPTGQQL